MATRQSRVDVRGQLIEESMLIAVAFRVVNRAEIRVGKVKRIKADVGYYGMAVNKATVEWLTGNVKTSDIELDPSRIVILR